MRAALLLALLAHAVLVSTTHFHRAGQAASAAPPGVSQARDAKDSGASPDAGGQHAQCLLCRLQRNLVSDLHDSTPSFAAPQRISPRFAAPPVLSDADRSFLIPAGRAPPHA